jgi:uncharacterized DUF497 family protein
MPLPRQSAESAFVRQVIRIISARELTRAERQAYEEEIQE